MEDDDFATLFVSEVTAAQPKMRSYIAKLVANASSVDDILQESNRVLWEKQEDWQEGTVFLKWAYRVCFFQVKAYFRNQSREKLVFNDELLDILGNDSTPENNSKEREIAMNQCLGKLANHDSALLLERYQ